MNPSELVTLGKTGLQVSRLGLGTGPLGMVHDDEVWKQIIDGALSAGIRSLDTSPYYGFGNSERRLGRALARHERDSYVLSTKVGRLLRHDAPLDPFAVAYYYPTGMPDDVPRTVYDYSRTGTLLSLAESRERLGIRKIDMVHIHDIIELASGIDHVDEAISEAFPALSELRAAGEISAIGAGVQVNDLILKLGSTCDFDCFLIAGRYTLLDQSAADEALPLCVERGISVIIGSPYNTGILYDPKPGVTFDFVPAPDELIHKAQRIKQVCERYEVPLPAAAIQFPFAHPAVVQVLTGARSLSELKENLDLMRVEIPRDLWDDLREEGLLSEAAIVPT
ncbi:MAG TPA: aldo/keto reductase [Candidatus Dormibacteraeota bacterium]|nr:aldo/keto reductase [Candidatus Dormibacteraeota bacterium]